MAIFALAMAAAVPAKAEILFEGFLKITSANKACTKGPKVGTILRSRFHPGTVTGAMQNWAGSAIDIYNPFDSRSYRLNSGMFGATLTNVYNTTLLSTTLKTMKPSKLSITSQTPASITNTTTSLTFAGKIMNPNGLKGQETCLVGYLWAGYVRP